MKKTTEWQATIKVQFTSDWHIGDGRGIQGLMDRRVIRHPTDQLPYIPAKTLTGLLRDACEQLASTLDYGREEPLAQHWVQCLFGGGHKFEPSGETSDGKVQTHLAPDFSRVFIQEARFSPKLRAAIKQYPSVEQALTFIKPGIKVNEHGVAEDQMLRFDEVVVGGVSLHSNLNVQCEESWAQKHNDFVKAFLIAGAALIERMGSKRRRGFGRCRVGIHFTDYAALQKHQQIQEKLLNVPELPPNVLNTSMTQWGFENSNKNTELKCSNTLEWKKIRLSLQLEQGLVAAKNTLGNQVNSLDYIPGAYIFGAILNGFSHDSEVKHQLFNAMITGQSRVLNAYLSVKNQRSLPIPLSWYQLKEESESNKHNPFFIDRCFGDKIQKPSKKKKKTHSNQSQDQPKYQRKAVRNGFVHWSDGEENLTSPKSVHYLKPSKSFSIHATIEDDSQRPTSEVGGVYSYESIAAGQTFISEWWIKQDLWDRLGWQEHLPPLPSEFRLGTAKKDDFGRVLLDCTIDESESNKSITTQHSLSLWLTSPLLLRDQALRPSTDHNVLREYIELALDIQLSPSHQENAVYSGHHRDEGFLRSWGFPRPSRIGFAAGSVFRWQIETELADSQLSNFENRLQALQQRGLGERTSEGYGEVIFNSELLDKNHHNSGYQKFNAAETASLIRGEIENKNTDKERFDWKDYKSLYQRALRIYLQKQSLHFLLNDDFRRNTFGWSSTQPENSQLGHLMSEFSTMDTDVAHEFSKGYQREAAKNLVNWIDKLEDVSNRWDKWAVHYKSVSLQDSLKALKQTLSHFSNNKTPETQLEFDVWTKLDIKPDTFPRDESFEVWQEKWGLTALSIFWTTALQAELKSRARKSNHEDPLNAEPSVPEGQ